MDKLERMEKENRFIEQTRPILDKLYTWQLERKEKGKEPSKESIQEQFYLFAIFVKEGKRNGISDSTCFLVQGRNVIDMFQTFIDIVPEFKAFK